MIGTCPSKIAAAVLALAAAILAAAPGAGAEPEANAKVNPAEVAVRDEKAAGQGSEGASR